MGNINDDRKFPKFNFSPKRGENFLLGVIKPADEAIKRCESFSYDLQDEIECLKKARESYSLIKYQYESETIKLLKFIDHPYGTNPQDLLIRNKIRDLDEVIDIVKSDIENIEKVLTAKVKQYKNKQQKPPEEKKISQSKRTKLNLPIRKQHGFWGSKELFHSLLQQLSLVGNGFIDEESANNWECIYNDHFTGDIDDCSKENKINWKEALSAFKYFYDKFFENYFIGEAGYTVFFEAHFLHHGKEKSANDVKPRNKCPKNNQIKLDRIFECLESLKK